MKAILLAINHAYILFGATLYCGVLWSLRFFWFPTWRNLQIDNYYEQFIPQTTAATQFFTVVVPIMFFCCLVMIVSEWRTKFRWAAIGALVCLGAGTWDGQLYIIPINKILATHITDQNQLTTLLERWMMLNDIRWVLLTLMWLVMMVYFIAKGNLLAALAESPPATSNATAASKGTAAGRV
jgi:hypothetical protein